MIKLKNTTNSEIILRGILFRELGAETNNERIINETERLLWANDSEVLSNISNGNIELSLNDIPILDINTAINTLKNNLPAQVNSSNQPFASKILSNGKKLFMRVHGIQAQVSGAPDNIDFTIPYTNCKITGIEILNGELGDKINFKVLDTASGTISGIPNYMLNQFGFDVRIGSALYKHESGYDADLIQGMVLRLEYDAITSDLLPKNVYINFILHEVKD